MIANRYACHIRSGSRVCEDGSEGVSKGEGERGERSPMLTPTLRLRCLNPQSTSPTPKALIWGMGGYDQLTNLRRELFTDRIRALGLLAEVCALRYAPSAYPLEVRLLEHRINGHLEHSIGGHLTEEPLGLIGLELFAL